MKFWEVWNEVNTGWLKPGPQDTGAEPFAKLYKKAVGSESIDQEAVRRFEAYCKLYRATASGVRRADPDAKIGGPALAERSVRLGRNAVVGVPTREVSLAGVEVELAEGATVYGQISSIRGARTT